MLVRYEDGPELRMRLYLVELQSGSGLSGMPVFARLPSSHGAETSRVSLLGTLVGRWDDDVNRMGLAKVLPAQLLKDLLFQEEEVARRREAEQQDDGWLAPA